MVAAVMIIIIHHQRSFSGTEREREIISIRPTFEDMWLSL
jgi:hypothetical protein